MKERRYGLFKEIYKDFFNWLKVAEPVTHKIIRRYMFDFWMVGGPRAILATRYYGMYTIDLNRERED